MGTSSQTCNGFQPGNTQLSWQCMGYAEKLGYDSTGANPRNNANGWTTSTSSSALDNLKAGDIVRYKNNGHSIFVTGVSGDTVTYTDCNSDGHCIIRWDATISKQTLKSSFSYVRISPGISLESHALDLNGLLDGKEDGGLGNYGTADVYLNGSLVADDVNDYYNTSVSNNTTYEIKDIKAKSGYEYKGVSQGSLSGTVSGGNVNVRLSFTTIPKGSEMATGGSKVIPEGDYLIAAAGTTDKSTFYYLDIEGIAQPAANGTNVSLCGPLTKDPPSYEIWSLSYQDGFYTIKQKGTNMALDVADASPLSGKNVWVYQSNGSSAQKWVISFNGTDGYRLQAKCSGFSLDINGGKITNGVNVQQWENNNSAAQSWLFIPYQPSQTLADGRYILLSEVDNTIELDVPGDTGTIEDKTALQVWKDTAPSQYNSFDVKKLDNGYYSLIHAASGKAMEVFGGGSGTKTSASLLNPNGSNAQQWAITKDGYNEGYTLRVKTSGYALDLANAATANGSQVRQYPYNGSKAETWKFVPAEYKVTYDANGGTNTPVGQTKYYKTDLTLSSSEPKREGYNFLGWSMLKTAKTPLFKAGDTYRANQNALFYAVWEKLVPDLVLPASLKTVEAEAFAGGSFSYVQLPDSVK